MAQPGDEIAIELDELEMRIRAIVGERDGFPAPGTVARTEGPSGGASVAFELALTSAALKLSRAATRVAKELRDLEDDMAANGAALVEADGLIAKDIQSLDGLIDSLPEPGVAKSTAPTTQTTATDAATLG